MTLYICRLLFIGTIEGSCLPRKNYTKFILSGIVGTCTQVNEEGLSDAKISACGYGDVSK